MVNLENYCDRYAIQPDVIKIDVEGAEVLVLHGIEGLLMKWRPRMIISTHSDELNRQCRDFLGLRGFQVSSLDGFDHELIV